LSQQKYASFGAFTFVATYVPNSPDDKPLKEALEAILGAAPTAADMGRWRRLHFEAHAMTVADTRNRIEGGNDDTPKKLPAAERASRFEMQKTKLSGLTWTPSLEPSYALVDRVQAQVEENLGSYVSLDLCTSRAQEIAGVKKDKEITAVVEPNHNLKIATKEPDMKAPIASDLHLRLAFRRRALAYDQCNLIGYEVLEAWAEKLFGAMELIPPPSYASVSRSQILSADQALFSKAIEVCRRGIVPRTDKGLLVRPFEEALLKFMDDPSVIFNLLPLPIGSGKHKTSLDVEMEGSAKKQKGEFPKPSARGKGKGKGKGKKDPPKLPQSLAGCWKNVRGKAACKFFNMNICKSDARPGESCNQGVHLCMAPTCGQPHPAASCDKNPANKKKSE
jgi:hypothetical protein